MPHYKWAVFIGRFAPFHRGHYNTLQHGLEIADRVLILLGSARQARNTRNPLTWTERRDIIEASLTQEDRARISYAPLVDFPYSEARWSSEVQRIVWETTQNLGVVLIGVEKDSTSYYLNEFPMWDYEPVEITENISATDIRTDLCKYYVPSPSVRESMCTEEAYFKLLDLWPEEVREMWRYEKAYERKYGLGPFITVDAAVVQSGHILLVTRGEYGKGQLAMPGGFVEKDETLVDAMIRELREETRLKVPEKVLRGSIKKNQIFDAPNRSARSRIITYAYGIELNDSEPLPKVQAGSDAKKAEWIPLVAINPENMFEDHFYIIATLHGLSVR
jgi:bifunctional NMN adenylyltransferase/nudix hydrolase